MTTDLLEVALLPGKGRGYKTTNDVAVGTVLHIAEPYATTVSQEWIPETCMWCFDFSYPKKQKTKPINEEEQADLLKEWEKRQFKRKNNLLCKDILFCSEQCKEQFREHSPYWKNVLAMNHRLDLEYKKSSEISGNITREPVNLGKINKWIDVDDDTSLTQWLDEAWDCLTENLDLYKEPDEADKSICRLIASCILRKNSKEENNVTNRLTFDDLLVIQNNELIYFRSYFSPNPLYPKKLPILENLEGDVKKEVLSSIVPNEILEIMALYSFFTRALTADMTIPTLPDVNHALFRSIFFREKANSFGIWEMSSTGVNGVNDGVSDDLELLGYGIYPSAVYFNHSCDPNVVKVRDGQKMKFIARRMIEKGEEACISYGNVGEGLETRRSRLLEHYHFLCQCTRCIEEDKLRKMTR